MSSPMNDETSEATAASRENEAGPRILPPAAERALAEAAARRTAEAQAASLPREVNGRAGPEPTRFGDWERNGLACDF
jgi:hypothetical protein